MYASQSSFDPVICPYNKNHLIAPSRLQKHIVKCEKNYPEGYKVLCPYDAKHRLFKHELEEHIITCPMRRVLEPEMYQEPRKHGALNFILQSEISSTIDCEESWDLESNTDTKSDVNDDYLKYSDFDGTLDASVQNKDSTDLRTPRGFSEAMLKEANDDTCTEDIESVVSSMGVGRGKATAKNAQLLKLIGRGRGRPLNNDL